MFHFDVDFKDKNGERYMLPIRIQTLLEQLRRRAIPYREPLKQVQMLDGKHAVSELATAEGWTDFSTENDYWGGRDHYVWFRHSFVIPEQLAGKTVIYSVEAGDSGYWQWANPQMCLYLNGQCISGVDCNHRDIEFDTNAQAGKHYEVYISGYTDTVYYERPVRFRPHLMSIEPETWSLYYDLKVAYETAQELNPDDLARVEIIQTVNHAFNLLEMQETDEVLFLESVRKATAYIQQTIYTGNSGGKKPVVAAVGSTHIDVAWLWRYEQTREKVCRSFATAVRLVDKNPEYIFMCSQAQLYDFLKQDDPALYEEVKRCIREGRWEIEGGMWVEADTNLACGESLVRQFLVGKQFFQKEFGADSKVLWLPDVFGYSAALPQIMKKSGVDYFMTTKISWNEFNKVPYDTFYWRGIDGSKVLSHFIPTKEKVQEEKDWMTTYNGRLNPKCVMGAWQRYQQKDLNQEVLASFGHGDGGGGTTQDMVEHAKRIAKGIPGCPDLRFTKVQDFFRKLEQDVGENPKTPCWDGELYFEYHRGTYTSVAGIKRRNRKNEIRSHDAENLSVLAGVLNGDLEKTYPQKELEESWKLLLLNQFHDVLPGSSIGPVYVDAYEHHNQITRITEDTSDSAMDRIAGGICVKSDSVIVFNTLSFARSAPVVFPYCAQGQIGLERDGTVVPAVLQADGTWLFVAQDVPAKGYCTYKIVPVADAEQAAPVGINHLENDHYAIDFDENMNISRLWCKQQQRDMMAPGQIAGRLIAFEDDPKVDAAWNLMAYYEEKFHYVDDVQSAQVVENNAIRTVLRVKRKFRSSTMQQDYILYRDRPGLELQMELDWKERDIALKLEFPVQVNATKATYDIQFGNIERPIHKNTLWDFARFEVCAHKWVDLSDNGFGISLLNDCKYGYDVTREHIRLSVLRCATYPDPMQDKCFHEFACMLLPHSGGVDLAEVSRQAYSFNYPLHARTTAPQEGVLAAEYSMVSVDRENVILETVKKAEASDAIVLRFYECANCGTNAQIKLGFDAKEAWVCDLMENTQERVPLKDRTLQLSFAPYEIKTVMLK